MAELAVVASGNDLTTPGGRALCAVPVGEPDTGYTLRGGGDPSEGGMHDGCKFYELFPMKTGDLGQVEAPTDRSGVSGSGRSGRVEYKLRDWVYRIVETTGSVKRQSTNERFALRHRGEWYEIDKETAMLALGLDPDEVERNRMMRRAESATPVD